eukprot:1177799-Prorocentrum_minimum.AAC.5
MENSVLPAIICGKPRKQPTEIASLNGPPARGANSPTRGANSPTRGANSPAALTEPRLGLDTGMRTCARYIVGESNSPVVRWLDKGLTNARVEP